jgi:NOL1/NOP2/fmu family ribosome biogenesis protein
MRIWENSGIRTEKPNAAFGNRLARIGFLPDLKGIQTLRIGLQIGEIRGRNLIPDHAAALGMFRPSMTETEMTDAEALKYLAGETIAGETRGWTLMTWRGLALGWGKGSDGMIRNHYPKGLRNGRLEV